MSLTERCYRVGSRESPLAMLQTNLVVEELKKIYPYTKFEILGIKTTGDKILDVSLEGIGSKALFTKELEIALIEGKIDFAVHSLKDLPTMLPEGLTIGAITKRADPRDVVILKQGINTEQDLQLRNLMDGSVIGTGSPRRVAQLHQKYPNLQSMDIRGNLNTRLRKLDDERGPYSAIILAAAGVLRMGWQSRISMYLNEVEWKHAVGQGALAVECLSTNLDVLQLLQPITDPVTYFCCVAERCFLKILEGGCTVPVGVNTKVTSDSFLHLSGSIYKKDGSKFVEVNGSINLLGEYNDPSKFLTEPSDLSFIHKQDFPCYHSNSCSVAAQLGKELGEEALRSGAKDILNAEQKA